jgi:hypothetical protein
MTPVEAQVRLVGQAIESAAARNRNVAALHAASGADIAEFDVITRPTVAIHPTSILFATRTGLHHPAAYLAIPDFADA